MEQLVTYIVRGLVDNPDDVRVGKVEGDATVILELEVNPRDVDLVVGDGGQTLEHLRSVVAAASGRRKALVELVEPGKASASSGTEE